MQLVILAAGMGSRFGGLKQIEPIDEKGNFLLDYSIRDAIEVGFDSVVLVIKKENYEIFKETVGKRIENKIKVNYAFQDMNDLPSPFKAPEGRIKPWGTAHAIYAARHVITDNFIILNADDYYGKETLKIAHDYLSALKDDDAGKYANVAFEVSKTLTESGAVKRGVPVSNDGKTISKLLECNIENVDGKIMCTPLNSERSFEIEPNQLVSMNLFAFTKDILTNLEERFPLWLKENGNSLKNEFLIPVVVGELIKDKKASLQFVRTPSKWCGMTYKEDMQKVKNFINKLKR